MYFQALDEMKRIIHPYHDRYIEEVMQRWDDFLENYQFYAIQKNVWVRRQKVGKGEAAPASIWYHFSTMELNTLLKYAFYRPEQ